MWTYFRFWIRKCFFGEENAIMEDFYSFIQKNIKGWDLFDINFSKTDLVKYRLL